MRFNLLKLLAICCLSALFTPTLRAQDSLLKKIDSNVSRLGMTVDSLKDSLHTRPDTAIANSFSASHDDALHHPEKLYLHPFPAHEVISIVTFIFLGFFLYKFFQYFLTTGLSRDESYDKNWTLKAVKDRTFSYGRVQLCFWTLIILFCFIWFYAWYGVLLPLNSTVVLLLGSGLAVFIFGKTIDKNQIDKDNKKDKNDKEDRPLRHQDVENSRGFLTDILSDDTGISIHRLQAVAFNVIFGIGFLGSFFSNIVDHKYPFIEFESWQLSLLGISAAGYLGLKTSENDKSTKEDRKDIADAQQAVDAANPRDPNDPDAAKDPPRPQDPNNPNTPVAPVEQPATRNREGAE